VDLTGTWSGSYDCLQGATALTLEVQHDLFDDTLRAEFAFGPSRQNPDVPTGRYTMEGEFMSLFGSVSLFPTGWIEQPEGYGMVGLEATYDVFGDTLTGYIDAADCGDLSLQRVQ